MLTQPKKQQPTNLKFLFQVGYIGVGVAAGVMMGLLGLWLWIDYQQHLDLSLLAGFSRQVAQLIPWNIHSFVSQQAQLMGLPLASDTSAYWYMARAGGIVGYLLLWFSTMWGLTLSTKVAREIVPGPIAYGLHEFLSLGAILFSLIHSLVLLGDTYINFNMFDLAIPFTAPYEALWTGLGTTGFYLMAVITASFYVRKFIGHRAWRVLHYFTFVVFALALVHGLMAGTDSKLIGMQWMYAGTGLSILFLTFVRLLTLKTR